MSTTLVLLIPGSARVARGWQRDRFVKGLVETSEDPIVTTVEAPSAFPVAVGLSLRSTSGERRLDVVEAYWSDLAPSLHGTGAKDRFIRGTQLLFYWAFAPKIWRGFAKRRYLTLGLVTAGLALVLWYYGTFAMFLEAYLRSQPSLGEGVLTQLHLALQRIGTWKIWAASSLVMSLIPVTLLVDIMDLTKRVLTDERGEGESVGLRVQIRHRVREQILAALHMGHYETLTVVGHSFGTLVAMDVLGDLPLPPELRLRFVTLGSPIELLARRAPWLAAERAKCLARPDLDEWVDIWSDDDWFASGAELSGSGRFRNVSVPVAGTFVDRIFGRTHVGYFAHETVVAEVVKP